MTVECAAVLTDLTLQEKIKEFVQLQKKTQFDVSIYSNGKL